MWFPGLLLLVPPPVAVVPLGLLAEYLFCPHVVLASPVLLSIVLSHHKVSDLLHQLLLRYSTTLLLRLSLARLALLLLLLSNLLVRPPLALSIRHFISVFLRLAHLLSGFDRRPLLCHDGEHVVCIVRRRHGFLYSCGPLLDLLSRGEFDVSLFHRGYKLHNLGVGIIEGRLCSFQ